MTRFEKINGTFVNVDRIRGYWRGINQEMDMIHVELDNGEVIDALDEHHVIENQINGFYFIEQVIPCQKVLYARYISNGKEWEEPVYYLALCADGCVRPFDICGPEGCTFADDADNFIGLYSKTIKEENVDE